ncbi:MAG TPA: OmpA family protein [Chitinophagales bacterium]|jgi:outer membrane protein OmpA-like peptidoglycan-associated protein|nr:OmpA family protein [Chitinophagales bacterium]MBP6154211.1 OmpA family protein [Chitinophagales bacterium]HQV77528.1 OmpA family protein [Chitinophagales bacterium]HQW79647.1 OmpA family protein [Chitinophagales bacterium]HRB92869.1 OmpA family protein [Chitinophagales bacterium]
MKNKINLFILFLFIAIYAQAEKSYSIQNDALILPNKIQFDVHDYDIKNEADPMLDLIADYLKDKNTITKFRIEGHVYTEKSQEENMKLSLQRAAMISYYLTERGISCDRLIPVAFGDMKPIAPTDECNINNNTRISFFNAEINYMAIPGKAVDGFAIKEFNPCE